MDGVFESRAAVGSSEADPYLRLRMSALFRRLQEISVAHTELLGAGRAKTLDRGLLWVMTRLRVSAARLPVYGEEIRLSTWPGGTMHVIFPRYCTLCSSGGEVLVRSSALWVLMDARTRAVIDPQEAGIAVAGVRRGGELPLPGPLPAPKAERVCTRQVRYSDIDCNGHAGNTRCPDWLDDLVPPEDHRTHFWKELQVNYLSELLPGAEVEIAWEHSGDRWAAEGSAGGRPAFRIAAEAGTLT